MPGLPSRVTLRLRGMVGLVPAGVLPVVHGAGGCVVRADRHGAVRRWAGAIAGRADVGGRASPRARRDVRRAGPRAGGDRAAASGVDVAAAASGCDGRIVLAVDVSPWLRSDAP